MKFKVGDTVLVTRIAKDRENGWGDSWIHKMDSFVGKTHKVTDLIDYDTSGGVNIFRLGDWWFPEFVLQKVDVKKVQFKELKNGQSFKCNDREYVKVPGFRIGTKNFNAIHLNVPTFFPSKFVVEST